MTDRANPRIQLLGETDAGRPLLCVAIEFPGGKAYPVTAREMTTNEKRLERTGYTGPSTLTLG